MKPPGSGHLDRMHARLAGLAVAALLALPATAAAQGDSPGEYAVGAGGHIALITLEKGQHRAALQVIGPDGRPSPWEVIADGSPSPIATIGPRGDVLVLWYDNDKLWVRYRPVAGVLGPPELVTEKADFLGYGWSMGIDAAGTATLTYIDEGGRPASGLQVRTRTEAGVWSAPQDLGGEQVFAPSLAVTPNGSAVLAWRQQGPSGHENINELVMATRGPGAAAFGAVTRVVGERENPNVVSTVAANDRGDAVVGWTRDISDSLSDVYARFRAPDGRFGAAVKLNRTRDMSGPQAAVLPNGRMVLAWTNHLYRRAEGRVRRADGTLGPVRKFTEDLEQNSQVFPLAVGRGAIAWADRDPGVGTLRIAYTTASGRILEGETITRVRGWTQGPAITVGPEGPILVASRPLYTTDPIRWLRAPLP